MLQVALKKGKQVTISQERESRNNKQGMANQVEMVMRHKSRIGFFVGAWVGMSVMPFTYPVDNLPQVEIVFAPPWVSVGEVFQVVVQGSQKTAERI